MAAAALALAIFLLYLVWGLYREMSQKDKQVESRVRAIEDLGEPFASKVAGSAPVPLRADATHIGAIV
jgi:hypothetical protein